MGYGLAVYAVDLDAVAAACGSGDDKVRRMISGRFRRDIYSTNDQLGWSNDRGADSVFEAIRHLIMGADDMRLPGAMYGYAYKYIIEFHGRFLANDRFMPARQSWVSETIQPQLAAAGVALNLDALYYGGAPVSFPSPDDFPGYGCWRRDAIAAALPILRAQPDLSPELAQIADWLSQAAAENKDLAAFYH